MTRILAIDPEGWRQHVAVCAVCKGADHVCLEAVAWATLGTRGALLRETLAATVPLRMTELADHNPAQLVADLRRIHAVEGQDTLLPYVDELLYGQASERVTRARRALIDGLAVLALTADGGVTLFDLHWCTDHQRCIDAKEAA